MKGCYDQCNRTDPKIKIKIKTEGVCVGRRQATRTRRRGNGTKTTVIDFELGDEVNIETEEFLIRD